MTDPVERYLRDLHRELHGVPRARRDEILDDVGAHLEEARAQAADEAELRTLIERLGDPAEIAAEARGPVPAPRRGWRETVALVMLTAGSIVLPLVGWLVGLVLLWVSSVWTLRDKLIGTLLVPGGFLPGVALSLMAGSTCHGAGTSAGVATSSCSGPGAWRIALAIVVWVGPVASALYLAWRARARSQPSSALGAAIALP
jgi:hypothetical protein